MSAWVDRPYFANRYGAVSDPSANVSRSPTRCSGRPRPASAMVSATADPRPPMMVWFSAVTTIRAPAAAAWTVATSSGLMVATLMTETETPCSAEHPRRGQGGGEHHAAGEQGHVVAGHQDFGAAKSQHVILAEDDRGLAALEPDVHGPRHVHHRCGDLADLDRVRDIHHGHVGQRPHQRDIIDCLMARAAGRGHTGHEPDDAHGQARVRDGVSDLVEGAPGGEHAEGVHERDVAAAGEGTGHAHHVRLGHARVDEPLREFLLEQVNLALPGQVTAEAQHLIPAAGQVDQRPAVGLDLRGIGRLTHGGPPACR